MTGNHAFGATFFCIILFHLSGKSAANGDSGCEEELHRVRVEFRNYRTRVLLALKQILDNEVMQICPSCTGSGAEVRSMQLKLDQMERTLKDLAGVAITSAGGKSPTHVHHVIAKVNSSRTLSCESRGNPLSSCLWRRTVKGSQEVVIIDIRVIQNGGRPNLDGVSVVGYGFNEGKCSVQIESVKEVHVGSWRCMLIGKNEDVFTGKVLVTLEDMEPAIYFASWGDGMKAYSVFSSRMTTIIRTRESIYGIVYDSGNDKVYLCSNYKIFRSNRDGSEVETLLETTDYGKLAALAYDWVTGNIYAVTSGTGGHVIACDTKRNRMLTCATILSGQGYLAMIALNPVEGFMYWTKSGESNGAIVRAEMDGSNRATIVTGLKYPRGLAIDFEKSRLYWACKGDDTIQSSNLQGSDIRMVIQLQNGSCPIGVGLLHDRLYWTNYETKTLQSATMSGTGLQTLYTGNKRLYHFAIVPTLNYPTHRMNNCERQNCTNVCVLTATSFRCVA